MGDDRKRRRLLPVFCAATSARSSPLPEAPTCLARYCASARISPAPVDILHPNHSSKQQAPDLTAPGSQLTSSMYRDLKKGAPVEVDSILGDLLERGKKAGLTTPTPLLQAAFVNLSIYQRSLMEGRHPTRQIGETPVLQ